MTHACPDCGEQVPGDGSARCPGCALADRIARAAATEAETIGRAWARELFEGFCVWEGLPRDRGDMARHIATHAAFFRELDGAFTGADAIDQRGLLAAFGAERLRRSFNPVRYLVAHLALSWEESVAATVIEGARTEARLTSVRDRPWSADLAAFRRHLEDTARPIVPRALRGYVAAAAGLLAHADVRRAEGLTAAHVARHLRRKPGQSANLLRFLSWVSDRSGQSFAAMTKRTTLPRKRERATLRRADRLLDGLAAARDPREGRAVLVAAISVLHHLPLQQVLGLRRRDAAVDGDRVVLWPGGRRAELAAPLAAAFARFAARGGRLAFPGRNGVQPLSTMAVRHHVPARGATQW